MYFRMDDFLSFSESRIPSDYVPFSLGKSSFADECKVLCMYASTHLNCNENLIHLTKIPEDS